MKLNKLECHLSTRYGVRPLPKKQMVLKLKEIHQYTHQVMSSGSEEETSPRNRPRAAPAAFKQPTARPPVSPRKLQFGKELEDHQDDLPASQDSNTSSTAESERWNAHASAVAAVFTVIHIHSYFIG